MKSIWQPLSIGFVALVAAFILSCGGNAGDGGDTKVIGAEGGTITSSDGKIVLEIPAGALSEPTEITLNQGSTSDIPTEVREVAEATRLVQLEPSGLTFAVPATLRFELEPRSVNEDGAETQLPFLLSRSGETIEILDDQSLHVDLDTGATTLSGQLMHFSEVWDNLPKGAGIRVRFSDIPATWSVGPTFVAAARITRGLGNDLVVNAVAYRLRNVRPIECAENTNTGCEADSGPADAPPQDSFLNLPAGETTSFETDLQCARSGTGKYGSAVFFSGEVVHLSVTGWLGFRRSTESYEARAERAIECVEERTPTPQPPIPTTPPFVDLRTPTPVIGSPQVPGTALCSVRVATSQVGSQQIENGAILTDIRVDVTDEGGNKLSGYTVNVNLFKAGQFSAAMATTEDEGRITFRVQTTEPGDNGLDVSSVSNSDRQVCDIIQPSTISARWSTDADSPLPTPMPSIGVGGPGILLSCEHTKPGIESEVIVRGANLTAGDTVSGTVSGSGVIGNGQFTASVLSDGTFEARVRINLTGPYMVNVAGLGTFSINVGAACPG